MPVWNPWHGCTKISPGCLNCYVYRRDAEFGKDSRNVARTANFSLPLKKNRQKGYKLQPDQGEVYTCMTSDFFLEDADIWRPEAWKMIAMRRDLHFVIITKRIHRFLACIPEDWGVGYENVTIVCTCEDQKRADDRLPIFLNLPVRHRQIICEPLLGPMRITPYLQHGKIEQVTCGGESGDNARLCDFTWVLGLWQQCVENDTPFYFKQTGAKFKKGNRIYHIERKDQMTQAEKAGICYHMGANCCGKSDIWQ